MQAEPLPDRLIAEAALLRARGAAESNSDRLHRASETVARMRPEFRRLGITRVAQVTGLDRIGIPVWMAVRPNAKTLAVSQGKGLTDPAAQASAIMEAAELATAETRKLPSMFCSANELRAEGKPVAFMHDLLARGAVPHGEDDRLAWVEGYDLIQETAVWVPAAVVSLRRGNDDAGSTARYWRSSDGLASGNLLLEAIVHGLCERIERDAAALWLFRSDRDVFTRCMEPAALGDEAVLGLARQIERAGFHLRLFDITSDVDVPVFFATLSPPPDGFESHWKHFDISSGSGCHPLPARAAIRAITEAAQTRVTSIAGARDDFDPSLYHARAQGDFLTYLRALPNSGPVGCTEQPEPADNLPFLLARLRKAGISSAIFVPIDASEPGFAVAKVLVPELEHPPGERRSRFGKRALRAMAGLQ
jgi:ribosomal protein S12 methylthiotransferase accessory factor